MPTTKSIKHTLTCCREGATSQTWNLARKHGHTHPHTYPTAINQRWHHPRVRTPNDTPRRFDKQQPDEQGRGNRRSQTRLLQISVPKAAHLIWVLRCEQVMQDCLRTSAERKSHWNTVINTRKTDDIITATRIRGDNLYKPVVKNTWEHVLRNTGRPIHWTETREVF